MENMENENTAAAWVPGRRKVITSLVFAALFAALIAAGTFIAIPIGPVPVTLQNMFALLAGLVLGPFLGAGAVALFLAAGIVGAPIFAGANAGIAVILGPTGGYLLGYLLGTFAAGIILGTPAPGVKTPIWKLVLAVAVGFVLVYIPGLLWLNMFFSRTVLDEMGQVVSGGQIGLWRTLAAGFFPFIAGDAVKGVVAALVTPRLRRTAAQLFAR